MFSDEERAEVGIAYKQQGRYDAVLKGLKIVAPKLADFVEFASAQSSTDEILIHCWRGGMRSQSLAKILELAGLKTVLLEGGYKSFRAMARLVWQQPLKLIVVSGFTGAGKTKVLQKLADAGEQVVDLEQLANHRGSAFGGIGQPPQPSTEQFENQLFQTLDSFDLAKPIWIEDEGSRVGSVVVPDAVYQRIRVSPAVSIECDRERRVENLLHDYGDLSLGPLIDSIHKIRKRLGGLALKQAIEAAERGDLKASIEIVLAYYDKTYQTAIVTMPRNVTLSVKIDELTDVELIQTMKKICQDVYGASAAESCLL